MPEGSDRQRPIISEFADDPEMRELVDLFASEMPAKIANFEKAIADQQFDELRRLAHQLKGAAGGYGFGVVGDAAAKLEHRLQADSGAAGNGFADQVKRDVEELLALCRSVQAGS